MRTDVLILNTVPNATKVVAGELAYLKTEHIILVKREGVQYDVITTTPSNRQVKHTYSKGELEFGTAHPQGARVYVLYQH